MAEKETLLPKETGASSESLADPQSIQQSAKVLDPCLETSYAGPPSNLPSTSYAGPSSNLPSASDAGPSSNLPSTSYAGPSRNLSSTSYAGTSSNVQPISQGTGSKFVSAESGGSLDGISDIPSSPSKPKSGFKRERFKTFIKQGTHPSVPIPLEVPPIPAFNLALDHAKDIWLSSYVFIMIVIIVLQGVLILLCCGGYIELFKIGLLVFAVILLCLIMVIIGVAVYKAYSDIKSGSRLRTFVTVKKTYYKCETKYPEMTEAVRFLETVQVLDAEGTSDAEIAQMLQADLKRRSDISVEIHVTEPERESAESVQTQDAEPGRTSSASGQAQEAELQRTSAESVQTRDAELQRAAADVAQVQDAEPKKTDAVLVEDESATTQLRHRNISGEVERS